MSKKMKQSNPCLPDDILFEIRQRLPMKSLLRFMSVSKSWKASIQNPIFLSSYNHHHLLDKSSFRLTFLPYSVQTIPENRASNLASNPNCTIPKSRASNLASIPNCHPRGAFTGSCEGLACFFKRTYLLLWNPVIETSLNIPLNTRENPLSMSWGFGFAPKSCDHRVVKLIFNDSYNYLTEAEIYSLASDLWRRIKPPPMRFASIKINGGILQFTTSVYLDGSIYWMAEIWGNTRGNRKRLELILRFDLDEESFEEIAAPSNLEYPTVANLEYPTIAVIGGFLVIWTVSFSEAMRNTIQVRAHIHRRLNSGSSFWVAASTKYNFPEREETLFGLKTTKYGHIIVRFGHKGILTTHTYCDGEKLSFKTYHSDFGFVAVHTNYRVIPTTETLFLLDKK